MKLRNRIEILQTLKEYLTDNNHDWKTIKHRASIANGWFTPEFIDTAVKNIVSSFLDEQKLQAWINHYHIDDNINPKNVGIVMAGNIPLVGFHDFLAVFIAGHKQTIKLSSKDDILMKHIVEKMFHWNSEANQYIVFATMLKGCDAYIATGSNNSARYFDYYFAKYPSIIRRNRTSAAILSGNESAAALEKLSDDIHIYFGLGCRNVTKIYVPEQYDFVPLLQSFSGYKYFTDHHKYRNNYDYNLSLLILNNRFYMTNESIILVENPSLFSPIAQLNYEFYANADEVIETLRMSEDVQCIAGTDISFGQSQSPSLMDYADGVDTMQFLLTL